MTNEEILDKLISDKGDEQLDIFQEELAELIQAISKYKRSIFGDFDKEKAMEMLIEETADVQICLEQLPKLLHIETFNEKVEQTIDYKIKRVALRNGYEEPTRLPWWMNSNNK